MVELIRIKGLPALSAHSQEGVMTRLRLFALGLMLIAGIASTASGSERLVLYEYFCNTD